MLHLLFSDQQFIAGLSALFLFWIKQQYGSEKVRNVTINDFNCEYSSDINTCSIYNISIISVWYDEHICTVSLEIEFLLLRLLSWYLRIFKVDESAYDVIDKTSKSNKIRMEIVLCDSANAQIICDANVDDIRISRREPRWSSRSIVLPSTLPFNRRQQIHLG